MDKEKFVTKVDEAGHKIDNWVEDTAEKHNYPKWKIWLGLALAVTLISLAAVVLLK